MNYVWDRRKGRSNLTRHGIAFEDAIGIFDGPTLEKVTYTDVSESERRIISAWRAERHERAAYWRSLG